MRKIQVLVAFVAVLAFGALAASSASAATEWLVSGKHPTAETSAPAHGLLQLTSDGVTFHCTGLFIGTVGPGALDLITLAENLTGTEKDLVSCEVTKDPFSVCGGVKALATLHAVNLPWHTMLELSGSTTVDHILPTTAGYEAVCSNGFKNKCEGLELSKFLGNDSDGALFEYNELETSKCSIGTGKIEKSVGLVLGATVS
jgi:hypothetical protein